MVTDKHSVVVVEDECWVAPLGFLGFLGVVVTHSRHVCRYARGSMGVDGRYGSQLHRAS